MVRDHTDSGSVTPTAQQVHYRCCCWHIDWTAAFAVLPHHRQERAAHGRTVSRRAPPCLRV